MRSKLRLRSNDRGTITDGSSVKNIVRALEISTNLNEDEIKVRSETLGL